MRFKLVQTGKCVSTTPKACDIGLLQRHWQGRIEILGDGCTVRFSKDPLHISESRNFA